MSDNKKDPNALAKLFGVEHMVTPKTLLNETESDIRRKYPNDVMKDIHTLLDDINQSVINKDIIGVCQCIDAINLRMKYLGDLANEIRRESGK